MKNEEFMKPAVEEALRAAEKGEVPIGAVAIVGNEIVGRAHNIRESAANPLGHAEILLIEKIAKAKNDWRLEDVTIFVTCEPCIMCMGAMLQARVKKIVYGCPDPKAGACGSLFDLSKDKRLNHQIEVGAGVLKDECSKLLSDFFKKLRK